VITTREHLDVQAARVLEHMQTLSDLYAEEIREADPRLSCALSQAIAAFDQYLSDGEPHRATSVA
jgi:hypothetical protein